MSQKQPLSEKFVKSLQLKPPASGSKFYFDSEVPGFAVRISSSGTITFVLNYFVDGAAKRYTLGTWPDFTVAQARKEADDLRHRIRGKEKFDPIEATKNEKASKLAAIDADRNEPTVTDLARDYMLVAEKKKRESSLRQDRQMIASTIVPAIGALKVKDVTCLDIERLHGSLKATPVRANRVLSLLSSIFNLAIRSEKAHRNPVKGVQHYHEEPRETWLSLDQLNDIFSALNRYPDQVAADAIRLLVLTGAREMEALSAEWSQFDLHRGVWTKPSHHTKQKKTEHVPLNDQALALLSRMDRTGRYLFPGADGKGHRVVIRKPWAQVLRMARLAEATIVASKRKGMMKTVWTSSVRIHDIRHSFASHLVSRGASLQLVGKLLGHTRTETTARYAHCAPEAVREVANSFPQLTSTLQ
ncbi:MAG TPA: site-specific integrase [Candidatus Acidoferrum sp.]|jgi:integrase|nr:site-specific integrase [Candidatus Acidoferrum sp.]